MRRLTLKSQADDLEAEMNDIRKRLTTQQKESNGIQKALTALEIKLEQKRADRHSLLKSCKVLSVNSNYTGPLGHKPCMPSSVSRSSVIKM